MCLLGLRRRASERPDSSCSRKSRRVCPVLIESYVKIPAINSDASRKGNFLLYCAPSPRPKGRGLRGICRSSRDGQQNRRYSPWRSKKSTSGYNSIRPSNTFTASPPTLTVSISLGGPTNSIVAWPGLLTKCPCSARRIFFLFRP